MIYVDSVVDVIDRKARERAHDCAANVCVCVCCDGREQERRMHDERQERIKSQMQERVPSSSGETIVCFFCFGFLYPLFRVGGLVCL